MEVKIMHTECSECDRAQLMTARYFISRLSLLSEVVEEEVNLLAEVYVLSKLNLLQHLKYIHVSTNAPPEHKFRFIFKCSDLTAQNMFDITEGLCFIFRNYASTPKSHDEVLMHLEEKKSKSDYVAFYGEGLANVSPQMWKDCTITTTKTTPKLTQILKIDLDQLHDDVHNAN